MSWWIDRQNNDPFVKKRDQNQKISRAYFKLKEINDSFQLIGKNSTVLDLGAAPGGWSQYCKELKANITAVDILNDFRVKNIKFIQEDIFNENLLSKLDLNYDIVLSDIAPNLSGHRIVDDNKCLSLWKRILEIFILRKGSTFIIKLFKNSCFDEFIQLVRKYKLKYKIYKPKSSRKESNEIYLIGIK